ncbi:MAG TPA: glycosyltransferase, partial [Chryseolinea sp.]|nr:glycosyltransferase [Chryseolinea sp.]
MSNAIVIIPTYKERENIRAIIDTAFALPKDFHILIVDDNSPDGTGEIVEELQHHYNLTETKLHLLKRTGKLGLGTAYITGFKYALEKGYEYILEMDADFSHDPKDLVNPDFTNNVPETPVGIDFKDRTGFDKTEVCIHEISALLLNLKKALELGRPLQPADLSPLGSSGGNLRLQGLENALKEHGKNSGKAVLLPQTLRSMADTLR